MSVEAERGMGTIFISMAHGNAERWCVVYLTRGTIIMDLARQLCITLKKGRIPLVSKLTSALSLGVQYLGKTTATAFRLATGRISRNPGLIDMILLFYESLQRNRPAPVRADELLEISRLEEELYGAIEERMKQPREAPEACGAVTKRVYE
jgi:hypothetical protein